jgi:1,2-diacylglycerol-3-alpha-glucose alpha-1,2-glucosyltransferase
MRVNFLLEFIGKDILKVANGIHSSAFNFMNLLNEQGIKVTINGKGYDYDIFHSHTPLLQNYHRFVIARRRGIKLIAHAHATPDDVIGSYTFTKNPLILKMIGKYLINFYNKPDIVIAPSDWTKQTLIKRGVKKPIEVVSNGIDLKKFRMDSLKRNEFRKSNDFTNDDILVYSVGLIFLRKGIKTFKAVAKKLPNLKFIWIGQKLNTLFINPFEISKVLSNLPNNLKFLGFVDDIVAAHSGADIFLFPSYVENQGIAVLEAAACKKPLILRSLPVYENIIHKKNCFKAGTVKEFVRYVSLLSENQRLRKKFGNSAYGIAKKNNIEFSVKKLIKIYEDVLN